MAREISSNRCSSRYHGATSISASLSVLLLFLLSTAIAASSNLPSDVDYDKHLVNRTFIQRRRSAVNNLVQFPTHFSGSRTGDYEQDTSYGKAWIQGKPEAARDRASYASLSYSMDAEPYVGRRVQLQGFLSVKGIGSGGLAALFVRVVALDGSTLAFDNMEGRWLRSWEQTAAWQFVVLDVPDMPPASDTSCPDRRFVPATIDVGFLLCGGRGFVMLRFPSFRVVGLSVPVTGGPPPWAEPAITAAL